MGCIVSQPDEERLERLKTLVTRGRFMVLELRLQGNYIELNGEDVDGIHAALAGFFQERMDATPCLWKAGQEPFCDSKLKCNQNIYRIRGIEGENDMGLVAMSVIDFMSEKGWDFHCLEQLSFVFMRRPSNSPPPVANLIIELRPARNYIEVNGKDADAVFDAISGFFSRRLQATPWDWKGEEPFCNLKFSSTTIWRVRGMERENDAGMVATAFADFMSEQGWEVRDLMGTRGKHNRMGPYSTFLFVKRATPSPPAPHLTLELRPGVNYIEVNGQDVDGIYDVLRTYFRHLGTTEWDWQGQEPFCGLKLKSDKTLWRIRGVEGENDLGMTMVKIFDLMEKHGWALADHSGMQCTFVRHHQPSPPRSHLLVELRPLHGYIEVSGENKDRIYEELITFLQAWLSATLWDWKGQEPFCDLKLRCPNLCRVRGMQGENDHGLVLVAMMDFLGNSGWALVKRNRMSLLFAK